METITLKEENQPLKLNKTLIVDKGGKAIGTLFKEFLLTFEKILKN
jgi:hypothetical protein